MYMKTILLIGLLLMAGCSPYQDVVGERCKEACSALEGIYMTHYDGFTDDCVCSIDGKRKNIFAFAEEVEE